jgi:hypothetical protein
VVPVRLGQLQLWLAISGQYGVIRPAFEIIGRGEVFRVPTIGATGSIRLGWDFD